MEYLSALNPSDLLRSVSNISSEFGRRVWTSASPPQRPFRVCNHKRTIRKGLTAATRQELLAKVSRPSSLVPLAGVAKGLHKWQLVMMEQRGLKSHSCFLPLRAQWGGPHELRSVCSFST